MFRQTYNKRAVIDRCGGSEEIKLDQDNGVTAAHTFHGAVAAGLFRIPKFPGSYIGLAFGYRDRSCDILHFVQAHPRVLRHYRPRHIPSASQTRLRSTLHNVGD
jgi:hypothetical protein